MFFGWDKVGKKTHLLSSWLVAFGASLSALWILVANSWMQYPAGMHFNPDTGRSEMLDFWSVLFSPVAVNKFLHTISSGYITGALFVIAVSSYFLIKKREVLFAKRSMVVASIFGLVAALFLAFTGDGSAYQVAQKQPAKLAAMEGLYSGTESAGLTAFGILSPDAGTGKIEDDYYFRLEIPQMLSLLGYRDANAYVPGINDIIYGNQERNILPTENKIFLGKIAIRALDQYRKEKKAGNMHAADSLKLVIDQNYKYLGYGYLENPKDVIPNVPMTFYSFRVMVILGAWFILLFLVLLWFLIRNRIERKKFLLKLAILTFPLAFIASWAGWIVAEVGRQPWAIQDLLPTHMATSQINSSSVMITFILFAVLFTALLIAEIKIMWTAVKSGPKGGENV
jgi:cytochrome d ubiquinol oxidase subunit I